MARSSSSQQHGAKENVCTPRTETNVGPLCSQDVKMQQKGVSRHYLTPEILARTIRHHLVAAFYCYANIYSEYDNRYALALYTRTIRIICTYDVYRVLHTYENDAYVFFNIIIMSFGIGTAAAQPFSFGWPNKYASIRKKKLSRKRYRNAWSNQEILSENII